MTSGKLLERSSFLDELSSRFAEAARGSGQVVLLSGEAGSGKTSIVSEMIDRLLDGVPVRMVSCDAAGIHGPFGPVFDIAGSFGPRLAAALESDNAFDRVSRLILAELQSAETANVLVAEDLHWADQATLDLLRFLARRSGETNTLLVVTFRDDALEPEHELRRLTGDLQNQRNVSRLILPPLSLEAVQELAAPAGLDAHAVFALTGGNPFFVSELVNAPSGAIPQSIRDVILARAARLDPESRSVLDLAAVAGPSLDPKLLEAVLGQSPATELERCMHVGLLRTADSRIVFRHALTRDIVLGEMSPFRRADFARRILEQLERGAGKQRSSAELAHFAEEAGDATAVQAHAAVAAAEAARLGAHRQAALQYDRALRFSDGLESASLAKLLEARSFELHVTSQSRRAIEDISRAIDLRRELSDCMRLGDNLRRRSRYYWIAAEASQAEADALAALDALDPAEPSVELAMAYSNLSQLRMLANRNQDAIDWGERALALARELDAPDVQLHALTNIGTALAKLNRGGLAMLEEAERIGRRLGMHDDVARTFTNRTFMSLEQHDLQRATACAQEGIAFTDEHDILTLGDYLHGLLAVAQMERGSYSAAEREFVRLLDIPNLGAHTRIVTLVGLGQLRTRTGRDASDLLDEALAMADRTGEFQRLGPVRAARAEAAWLANKHDVALVEAEIGLTLSREQGGPWWNGILALWLKRSGGLPDPGIDVAGPYRLELDGRFQEAAADWARLGYPVQQARALAASGSIESMRTALDQLQSIDARADAARIANQLRTLGESSIPKGPRERTRDNPAQLTDRELEVLRLLAQGKSNREIAAELYISPRTCGHHVSAILAKLGVTTRAEAAAQAAALLNDK